MKITLHLFKIFWAFLSCGGQLCKKAGGIPFSGFTSGFIWTLKTPGTSISQGPLWLHIALGCCIDISSNSISWNFVIFLSTLKPPSNMQIYSASKLCTLQHWRHPPCPFNTPSCVLKRYSGGTCSWNKQRSNS